LFEKRRLTMRDWGKFTRQILTPGDVVPIQRKKTTRGIKPA